MSNKLVKNMNSSDQMRREREGKVRMNRKMIENAAMSLTIRDRAVIRVNINGENMMLVLYMYGDEIYSEIISTKLSNNNIEHFDKESHYICDEVIKLLDNEVELNRLFNERDRRLEEKRAKMRAESNKNNGLLKVGRFKYCDITCMTKDNTLDINPITDCLVKQVTYELSGNRDRSDWYYIATKLCGVSMLNSKNKTSLNDMFGKTSLEKMSHNYVNLYFNTKTGQFGFAFEDEKADIHFINAGIGTMDEDFSTFNMEYYCETGFLQFKLNYMLENCTENFRIFLLIFFIGCHKRGQKLDTKMLDILADYNVYLK